MLGLFQHSETGRLAWLDVSAPIAQQKWTVVPTMYEDELPANITDAEYDRWFENSVVDGVRLGSRLRDCLIFN